MFSCQVLVFDIDNSNMWRKFNGVATKILLPQFLLLFVYFFVGGACQKHVLHLLPGMSSDSDIECDTENEEQEDATSTSEGFNHAFSVQSSSEGRTGRVRVLWVCLSTAAEAGVVMVP